MKILHTQMNSILQKFLILIVLFFAIDTFQKVHGQGIRSGASFLKMLPGARQQGLSTSTTALLDEIYSFHANPGATGFFREHQWTVTYTKWITDIYNISLNFGRPIRTPWSKRTGIVLSLDYQGVREFDSSRGATPPASASDLLVTASMGYPVSFISKNLSVGANAKFIQSELDQFKENGFIFDLGTLLRTNRFQLSGGTNGPYGIFSLGVSATQIGNSLQFITTETPLPRTYRVGAAFYAGLHSGLQLQLAADYREIKDEISTYGFAAELSWRQRISIRGGYNDNERMLSKFSFGVSVRFDDQFFSGRNNALGIDFAALENNDFFSNAHRSTISHIPIGPERFSFLSEQGKVYTTYDKIQLTWETTRDPDLYDNVKYGILVTTDRQQLLHFIDGSENGEIDFLKGIQGSVAFSTDQTKFERYNKHQVSYNLLPLEVGDYYWTTWAYDLDRHVRFAEKDNQKIQHFRVIKEEVIVETPEPTPTPVDTSTNLVLAKTVTVDPIRLDIHFPFNIDTLNYSSQEQLNILGIALKSTEFQNLTVELGGHTDERGSDEYNQALSQRRVTSARRYLVDEIGISGNRIKAVGYGEFKPIHRNANTEEEHAENRRVELIFMEPSNLNVNPPNVVLHGDRYQYRLKVENTSSNAARNITFKDILPSNIHISEISLSPNIVSDALTWTFNSLAPNDSLVISYRATAPSFVDFNPFKTVNISQVLASNDPTTYDNIDSTIVYVIGTPDSIINYEEKTIENGKSEDESLITWAKYLQNAPEIDVCIECYTDNQGSSDQNLAFSQRKSENVKEFIMTWLARNTSTIPSLRINAKGRGVIRPVASNSTPEGRQQNRRIVIKLRPCN